MAHGKNSIAVLNKISAPPDPMLLCALGLPQNAPYELIQDKESNPDSGRIVWNFRFLFKPASCPSSCKANCSKRDHFVKSGNRRPVNYVHVASGSTVQILRITITNFFADCGEIVPQSPLPGMTDGYMMTLAARDFVVNELKAGTTVPYLARNLSESVSTIYRIKDEFIPKQMLKLCIDPTMQSFGIDEILIGKQYHTIFVDNTNKYFIGGGFNNEAQRDG